MSKELKRCNWVTKDEIYIEYHDKEWGVPLYDDQALFELLMLEGMQAGLSWLTVLKKRENFRSAFDNFNPDKISRYTPKKIEKLLENPGIIRNQLKVRAMIQNAKAYLALKASGVSFSDYLWNYVDQKPIQHKFSTIEQLLSRSDISDQLSKDLRKLGFNFVGTTICYAFMQAAGLVNDHLTTCFRHNLVKKHQK